MANAQDVIPPPQLALLHKLQLMRFTLVKLILECRGFEEIMTGCYARVLLEMRPNRNLQNGDNYFIVKVKGVHKGPPYTGFSWDGVTTDYHVLIEIPSCFRNAQSNSNNYVQLNSISNSPFSQSEYEEWVRLHREAQCPFQSAPQLQLRHQTLMENLELIKLHNSRQTRDSSIDPLVARDLRLRAEEEVKLDWVFLPPIDRLTQLSHDELLTLQRQCHVMMEKLRLTMFNRSRCRNCFNHTSTIICYPCKHQVLCNQCVAVTHCPAPNCNKFIAERIKPFVEGGA